MTGAWMREFPGGITVCDINGIILEMNENAQKIFAKDGGASLIGKNVFDCHPQHAKDKLSAMMKEGRMNAYTIEKNGIKKMIYQSPWYENGEYKGFVELSLEIPMEMAHFVRSPTG